MTTKRAVVISGLNKVGAIMNNEIDVQNGTDENLNGEVVLDSAANSSSKFDVTVQSKDCEKRQKSINQVIVTLFVLFSSSQLNTHLLRFIC